MNSLGFVRGYMAKNMDVENFTKAVATALGREFDFNVEVNNINDLYLFSLDNRYKIGVNKTLILHLMRRSPYALDRYILETIIEMGYELDKDRSSYVKYIFI